MPDGMSGSDNSTAESPPAAEPRTRTVNRPIQDRRKWAGSELGRQIPVDLQADADLNEGRGCPGHSSSSLTFLSSKLGVQVRSRRAATQAPATARERA